LATWHSCRCCCRPSELGVAAKLCGRLANPAPKGANKALFVLKPGSRCHLLDRAGGPQQQFERTRLAHLVFERLQRSALVFELPVQRARRHVEQCCQIVGAVTTGWLAGQRLAHLLHQQTVAPVLQHRQGQRAFEHVLQRGLVPTQRQGQVTRIKFNSCLRSIEAPWSRKKHLINSLMGGRRKSKLGAAQGNA